MDLQTSHVEYGNLDEEDINELTKRDAMRKFIEDEAEKENLAVVKTSDDYFSNKEYLNMLREYGLINEQDDDEASIPPGGAGDVQEELTMYERLMQKMMPIDKEQTAFKRVMEKGEGPPIPLESLVVFHQKAFYEDCDEPFDNSFSNKPFRMRIGIGKMTTGLDMALQTMRKSERSQFILKSEVMFGEQGCPPRIPANADIYVEIYVVNWMEKTLINDFFDMTEEERRGCDNQHVIRVINENIEEANSLFKERRYSTALYKYTMAQDCLTYLDMSEEQETLRNRLLIRINLNKAQCFIEIDRFRHAITCCNDVLRLDAQNVKAMYRKAKCLMQIGEYDLCADLAAKAYALCSNSREIVDLLRENDQAQKIARDTEKSMAALMIKATPPPLRQCGGETKKQYNRNNQLPENWRQSKFAMETSKMLQEFCGSASSNVQNCPLLDKSLMTMQEVCILEQLCEEHEVYLYVSSDNRFMIRK